MECEEASKRTTEFTGNSSFLDLSVMELGSTSAHDPSSDVPNPMVSERESRRINTSRWALVVILILAAAGFGSLTWFYTTGKEQDEFESAFEGLAEEVIQVSQINANNNFDGMKTLSDLLTSYALGSNATWPFVTHPNWPAVANTIGERLDARFVATVPLLDPSLRSEWENFTVAQQGWIQEAIDYVGDNFTGDPIIPHLFEFNPTQENPFVYEDDPMEDEYPFYMPLWQSTLVENPPFINFDARNDVHFYRSAKHLIETKGPIMSPPIGAWEYDATKVMALPEALICQPIFDSFDRNAKIVGILDAFVPLTQFDNILSGDRSDGIVVVLSNPCTEPQDFSWEIHGQTSVYLGQGNLHDPNYDPNQIQSPATGLKTAAGCPYTISLYPSSEFESQFRTNAPLLYTLIVVGIFLLAIVVFLLYDFHVQKRHKFMMAKGMEQAHRAAVAEREAAIAEREQNEYLAHEVRNPLSAALSACSFVTSAIHSPPLKEDEALQPVREDVAIIASSLKFINELLRNMLDLHRAVNRKVAIKKKEVDLYHDVLEPVASMLYCRDDNFELILDCPRNLVVETDSLRLKQILLNLGRNAAKFVDKGFVRLRAEAVRDDESHPCTLRIFVEDSGPGIPIEKRKALFAKFQQSLDVLSQGTGVGLCLCKQLIGVMGADLWLDEEFDSGVQGCPGACFVVDLRTRPRQVPLQFAIDDNSETYIGSQKSGGSSTTSSTPECQNSDSDALPTCEDGANANGNDPDANALEPQLPEDFSVLFVDDEMIQRKLFGRSIKRLRPGWRVQEASSGETAIRLVDSETFDLIFMDQYMASTEKQLLGTEATRELRAKGVKSKICGLSANDTEQAFLNAGANAFVLKPAPSDQTGLEKLLLKLLYKEGKEEE